MSKANDWLTRRLDHPHRHQWLDITTYNDGAAKRYICAACYKVRTEVPVA